MMEQKIAQYHSEQLALDYDELPPSIRGGRAANRTLQFATELAAQGEITEDVVFLRCFPSEVVMRPDGSTYHRLA